MGGEKRSQKEQVFEYMGYREAYAGKEVVLCRDICAHGIQDITEREWVVGRGIGEGD